MSMLSDIVGGNAGNTFNNIARNPAGAMIGVTTNTMTGGMLGPGGYALNSTPSNAGTSANPWATGTPGYATGANGAQGGGAQAYPGSPVTPGFTPNYTPDEALSPGYDAQVAGNEGGFQAFKNAALSQTQSPWAAQANQQQDLESLNQLDQGKQQTAGAEAGAKDALAAQGGLSSGARERVAETGANNEVNMGQNVARQENLNKLQIGMNDQQNKIQELSQLPGMENTLNQNWENAKSTDLSNQIAENQSVNSYNQNIYNQQMAAWGANQQANATANSGKKGIGK